MNSLVQNINWQGDVGIHLDMLNNQVPRGRNQFYQKIILNHVKDKVCLDIGFGTGLLSIIALEAGASHIIAFESNYHRYNLGVYIIEQLGLQDRISLIKDKFTTTTDIDHYEVVLHEIFGPNLWNEGLFYALPLNNSLLLPGAIRMDFEMYVISLESYKKFYLPKRKFNPEITINSKFVNVVQTLIDQTPSKFFKQGMLAAGSIPNKKIDNQFFYQIDFNRRVLTSNKGSLTFETLPTQHSEVMDLQIDQDTVLMLYPHSSIEHDIHRLPWCYYDPLFVFETGRYHVQQHFVSGDFSARLI